MSRTSRATSSSKRSPRVGSSGRPGSDGVMAGPRMPRPRRSRVRRRPGRGHGSHTRNRRRPASLNGPRRGRRYRRRRESRPAMFAHRVRPSGGHHADLRLRRPDGRASARSRPTPSRTPTTCATPRRAALGPARAGRCCASLPTRPRGALDRRPAGPGRRGPRGRPADGGRDPVAQRAAGDRRRPRDRPPRPPARAHLASDRRLRRRPVVRLHCVTTTDPANTRAVFKAYDVRGVVPDQIDETLARRTGAAFVPGRRGPRPSSSATTCGRARRRWPAAFADGRRRGRRRRGDDRAGLDRPALLRLRPPRASRRDVHREPQPGAVQRDQAVPGGRPADRCRHRPARDPRRWSRPPRPTPSRPPARSRSSTCSTPTPPTCSSLAPGRRPPAQGRRRRRQRHGRPHRARRLRPDRRRRSSWCRCTSSSTAPSRTTRPTRSSRRTSSTSRSGCVAEGADLGLAFDGDADRCFVVDERGEAVSPSTLTALIAARELAKEPGADGDPQPDHQPLRARAGRASSAADRCGPGSGTPTSRRPWPRPTRSSAASTAATSTSATSGGPTPGCSPRCTPWPRSPRPTGRCRELLADYQRYRLSGEINSEVADPAAATAAVEAAYADADGAEVDHLDGLTVTTADWWFNVRPVQHRAAAAPQRRGRRRAPP